MHFSKTYAQLLAELPPELSENAVQYRQLKKLINQVVSELALLGLGPTVLHDLLQTGVDASAKGTGKGAPARVMYEFNSDSGNIEPRLRLWVDPPQAPPPPDRVEEVEEAETENASQVELLWALQRHVPPLDTASQTVDSENKVEIVIPLASDSAFFQLLATTLQSLSDHLLEMQAQFVKTLQQLTITVSNSARPVSSTSSSFRAHSAFKSDAGGVRIDASSKSDLYAWREIFQLYVEAEIFESVGERKRGDHSVEESEKRLKQFAERVTDRGLGGGRKLKLAQSRKALESFLQLNLFILNVKKFELANAEATRKILKKHAKRTALPATDSSNTTSLALLPASDTSLPRILVQELGTTLLPIIPSLDDYACLICTSIAFKPIRLSCGHLFCVRCLVKMQKRGNAHCPMCRAPCVLLADRCASQSCAPFVFLAQCSVLANVDWALLNFMRDWFPEESTLKLKQNEREATNEQLEEMGIDPNERCIVM
ncbi:SPX domain-containing protein [Mycena alexandri]|uniref:SPX domain-containing protein n=1 Tax=Mycena alexandri TaxID=1745969 RepID=A0AAD6SGB8_9AGAR|nr:SPX domain-containing protein [Mycena alexandri]